MAYALSVGLNLGAANTGLTLEAQLVNTLGVNVGAAITTGFVEFGASGNYQFYNAAMPDGHQGGIVFQVSPGGAVKTFVAINPAEVEAAVVTVDETAIAAEVWSYPSRTLTTSIAAVDPPPVISGASVSVIKGDSWSLPFTDLGDLTGNTKLWLTVKSEYGDTDNEAVVQIERTVGLVRLNGAIATASQGSATVVDAPTGDVTFAVDEAATVLVEAGRYYYDVQSLIGGTVRTHTSGRFTVVAHVTSAIA